MKIIKSSEPLACNGCGAVVEAVVDSPTLGGGPWGHFCRDCVGMFAIATWRESSITTMLVHSMDDAF